jgi:hypothetical protein
MGVGKEGQLLIMSDGRNVATLQPDRAFPLGLRYGCHGFKLMDSFHIDGNNRGGQESGKVGAS